ncbi:tyrosine-type recombinase/integrase [Acidimicrobiaceae bacterium USS-CC1]|uniref:Tyrosine-type recombinase/integrase n=1 Tax=Acidiferrimicrobium australe TaxID=2664430 RepID=A0ABW9QVT5_9ACTN|nr:tyrosine-type recombinase/integrase [Acidiferrimicrobium australe]
MKGSTRKRGSTWTAMWSTTDPGSGQRLQHSKGGFRTQKEAREHLNAVLAKVAEGSWRPDRRITVRQLLDDWHAAKVSEGLGPNTAAMYRTVIDSWVVPHVGGLRLDQLTPAVAGRMVEELRSPTGSRHGRGALSGRSIQLAVQCLKSATRWAAETGMVSRDPLQGFKRPKAKATSDATGAWDAAEARQFLASIDDDRLRAAWWLLLGRGLRRGELAGLRWSAVDLEAGVLRVVETRVVVQAKAVSSLPKTDGSRRSVPLDDRLVAELRAHRARQAEERLRPGAAWQDTGFVFVDELGAPYRPETFSRTFTRLATAAGLRPIRLHDLRYTAATLMLASGENVKVVAEILGHSSPVVTQTIYQHVLPGQGRAAGERLSALLGG